MIIDTMPIYSKQLLDVRKLNVEVIKYILPELTLNQINNIVLFNRDKENFINYLKQNPNMLDKIILKYSDKINNPIFDSVFNIYKNQDLNSIKDQNSHTILKIDNNSKNNIDQIVNYQKDIIVSDNKTNGIHKINYNSSIDHENVFINLNTNQVREVNFIDVNNKKQAEAYLKSSSNSIDTFNIGLKDTTTDINLDTGLGSDKVNIIMQGKTGVVKITDTFNSNIVEGDLINIKIVDDVATNKIMLDANNNQQTINLNLSEIMKNVGFDIKIFDAKSLLLKINTSGNVQNKSEIKLLSSSENSGGTLNLSYGLNLNKSNDTTDKVNYEGFISLTGVTDPLKQISLLDIG